MNESTPVGVVEMFNGVRASLLRIPVNAITWSGEGDQSFRPWRSLIGAERRLIVTPLSSLIHSEHNIPWFEQTTRLDGRARGACWRRGVCAVQGAVGDALFASSTGPAGSTGLDRRSRAVVPDSTPGTIDHAPSFAAGRDFGVRSDAPLSSRR